MKTQKFLFDCCEIEYLVIDNIHGVNMDTYTLEVIDTGKQVKYLGHLWNFVPRQWTYSHDREYEVTEEVFSSDGGFADSALFGDAVFKTVTKIEKIFVDQYGNTTTEKFLHDGDKLLSVSLEKLAEIAKKILNGEQVEIEEKEEKKEVKEELPTTFKNGKTEMSKSEFFSYLLTNKYQTSPLTKTLEPISVQNVLKDERIVKYFKKINLL